MLDLFTEMGQKRGWDLMKPVKQARQMFLSHLKLMLQAGGTSYPGQGTSTYYCVEGDLLNSVAWLSTSKSC